MILINTYRLFLILIFKLAIIKDILLHIIIGVLRVLHDKWNLSFILIFLSGVLIVRPYICRTWSIDWRLSCLLTSKLFPDPNLKIRPSIWKPSSVSHHGQECRTKRYEHRAWSSLVRILRNLVISGENSAWSSLVKLVWLPM